MEIGDICIYMVCARHFSSAGGILRNVGRVKFQPFLNVVTIGNYTKNVLKWNLALWLQFSIKFSVYCAATVAKLSLYSICTRSAVSFGSVKKQKPLCIGVN